VGQPATGAIGRHAEKLACGYLVDRGLKLVARNFRCRSGEIDLIMLHDQCLAFIEVRFRRSNSFAAASHTVDRHKQKKIIRTAAMFIARNRRFAMASMRFDVVAIEGSDQPSIEWIADAFRPNDSTL
jgi:putative endonuclease